MARFLIGLLVGLVSFVMAAVIGSWVSGPSDPVATRPAPQIPAVPLSETVLPEEPEASFADPSDLAETLANPEPEAAMALLTPDATRPSVDPAPEAEPPVRAFAAPGDWTDGAGPAVAVVLMDTGQGPVPDLSRFPYPVTIALDPQSTGAGERMQTYRAAGIEVVLLARPGDTPPEALAQMIESWQASLPQVVALLEGPERGIQSNRAVADEVVAQITPRGLGLITRNHGHNTVSHLARQQGVPTAILFRPVDDANISAGDLHHILARAAERARRTQGQPNAAPVVVYLPMNDQTLSGLLGWALSERAANTRLVPVTAALRVAEPG